MKILKDSVAVRRSARERDEDDHVKMAFQHFAFHRHIMPGNAMLQVNAA
jgi:hypothetical protein